MTDPIKLPPKWVSISWGDAPRGTTVAVPETALRSANWVPRSELEAKDARIAAIDAQWQAAAAALEIWRPVVEAAKRQAQAWATFTAWDANRQASGSVGSDPFVRWEQACRETERAVDALPPPPATTGSRVVPGHVQLPAEAGGGHQWRPYKNREECSVCGERKYTLTPALRNVDEPCPGPADRLVPPATPEGERDDEAERQASEARQFGTEAHPNPPRDIIGETARALGWQMRGENAWVDLPTVALQVRLGEEKAMAELREVRAKYDQLVEAVKTMTELHNIAWKEERRQHEETRSRLSTAEAERDGAVKRAEELEDHETKAESILGEAHELLWRAEKRIRYEDVPGAISALQTDRNSWKSRAERAEAKESDLAWLTEWVRELLARNDDDRAMDAISWAMLDKLPEHIRAPGVVVFERAPDAATPDRTAEMLAKVDGIITGLTYMNSAPAQAVTELCAVVRELVEMVGGRRGDT